MYDEVYIKGWDRQRTMEMSYTALIIIIIIIIGFGLLMWSKFTKMGSFSNKKSSSETYFYVSKHAYHIFTLSSFHFASNVIFLNLRYKLLNG